MVALSTETALYIAGGLGAVVLVLLGALGWAVSGWFADTKAWRRETDKAIAALERDADAQRGVLGTTVRDVDSVEEKVDDFLAWANSNKIAGRTFSAPKRRTLSGLDPLITAPTLTRPAPASALRGVRESEET